MPNRLKMSKIQSVLALREKGWTYSRIARELGIHRETVARYVQRQENTVDRRARGVGGKTGRSASRLRRSKTDRSAAPHGRASYRS